MGELTTLAYRSAEKRDIAAVALVESAYRGEASRRLNDRGGSARWLAYRLCGGGRSAAAPEKLVLLAKLDGHLVGCCQLERRPPAEAHFGIFSVRHGRGNG